MSGAVTYRAITRGQTPDGVWHDAGAMFTTDAPEGDWMQPLDDDGRPIAKEKRPVVTKASLREVDVAEIRKEISEKAKAILDDMRTDFDAKLKAETERADAAEKQLASADEAADKATQRADAAEKERDALKAEVEKLKAPATGAKAK